jgi:hypothetical protein
MMKGPRCEVEVEVEVLDSGVEIRGREEALMR